jgi:hypothetical protein
VGCERSLWIRQVDGVGKWQWSDTFFRQWFNPLPGVLPPPSTKNERIADRDQFNEEQRIRAEKIAKGELEAEDPGPACGVVRSNYDLRPR